jgi:hypothetical protein
LKSVADITDYFAAVSGNVGTAADPIPLPVAVDLSGCGRADLLDEVNTSDKYVALDLSACTGKTVFDPAPGAADAGESKIVSLILPDAAESVSEGVYDYTENRHDASFRYFTSLENITGEGVKIIGNWAFSYPGSQALTVTLGAAVPTLGINMFYNIIGTKSVTVLVPSGSPDWNGITGTCNALCEIPD